MHIISPEAERPRSHAASMCTWVESGERRKVKVQACALGSKAGLIVVLVIGFGGFVSLSVTIRMRRKLVHASPVWRHENTYLYKVSERQINKLSNTPHVPTTHTRMSLRHNVGRRASGGGGNRDNYVGSGWRCGVDVMSDLTAAFSQRTPRRPHDTSPPTRV